MRRPIAVINVPTLGRPRTPVSAGHIVAHHIPERSQIHLSPDRKTLCETDNPDYPDTLAKQIRDMHAFPKCIQFAHGLTHSCRTRRQGNCRHSIIRRLSPRRRTNPLCPGNIKFLSSVGTDGAAGAFDEQPTDPYGGRPSSSASQTHQHGPPAADILREASPASLGDRVSASLSAAGYQILPTSVSGQHPPPTAQASETLCGL